MDVSHPISSVIPSAHGPVLAALVRAGIPLSGRQIAALVEGQVSRARVNSVLGELATSGLVHRESHPPSILYQFNRDHVAAAAIESLANLRQQFFGRMRDHVADWTVLPTAVWVFGSAARGDGSRDSDVDVLVVRPDSVDEEDVTWRGQLSDLADSVVAWSGNSCAILELSETELADNVDADHRLASDLRRDAVHLGGSPPSALLRQHVVGARR